MRRPSRSPRRPRRRCRGCGRRARSPCGRERSCTGARARRREACRAPRRVQRDVGELERKGTGGRAAQHGAARRGLVDDGRRACAGNGRRQPRPGRGWATSGCGRSGRRRRAASTPGSSARSAGVRGQRPRWPGRSARERAGRCREPELRGVVVDLRCRSSCCEGALASGLPGGSSVDVAAPRAAGRSPFAAAPATPLPFSTVIVVLLRRRAAWAWLDRLRLDAERGSFGGAFTSHVGVGELVDRGADGRRRGLELVGAADVDVGDRGVADVGLEDVAGREQGREQRVAKDGRSLRHDSQAATRRCA